MGRKVPRNSVFGRASGLIYIDAGMVKKCKNCSLVRASGATSSPDRVLEWNGVRSSGLEGKAENGVVQELRMRRNDGAQRRGQLGT